MLSVSLKMAEASEEPSYPDALVKALKDLNAIKRLDSQVITPNIGHSGQSARMLAVATVVLVHNKALGKEPNLDTLQSYDLNAFRDYDGLKDYVDYILYINSLERGAKKKDPLGAIEAFTRANYVFEIIFYMFILKSKGVTSAAH